ncbi:MAG TPA: SDR family oxidoreductase [Vicinamibacteria bacterium]|nr:SDR family oxidoreductase [Vicinamibacteria bacterium]
MPGFIVTGGTGALGGAVVRGLLLDAASVAVPYRDEQAWQALRDSAPPGALLWGAAVDLADAEATARFVDEAATRLDGLSGLAAIAGAFAGSGPLTDAPPGEWRHMMQANLDSAYTVCRAALPHLARTRGAIVTVGSRLAEQGGKGAAAYVVSKAAVAALTRVLALESRDKGVRANCVLPGTIDTAANRAGMPGADRSGWTPPEAIARVILFLLSPASSPVTGGVVPVDAPG